MALCTAHMCLRVQRHWPLAYAVSVFAAQQLLIPRPPITSQSATQQAVRHKQVHTIGPHRRPARHACTLSVCPLQEQHHCQHGCMTRAAVEGAPSQDPRPILNKQPPPPSIQACTQCIQRPKSDNGQARPLVHESAPAEAAADNHRQHHHHHQPALLSQQQQLHPRTYSMDTWGVQEGRESDPQPLRAEGHQECVNNNTTLAPTSTAACCPHTHAAP